jgi:hypothetical protein
VREALQERVEAPNQLTPLVSTLNTVVYSFSFPFERNGMSTLRLYKEIEKAKLETRGSKNKWSNRFVRRIQAYAGLP